MSDPSETDYYRDGNYTHTNKDRYWLRGKVDQNLGGWTTRLDLDVVSDRDYLTEFSSGLTGFTVSNQNFAEVFGRSFQNKTTDERKNTLRVLKSWNNMSLQGELLGINDVRVVKSDPTPLWKLPSLNFTGLLPVAGSSVNFDWDADYVNFWRKSGVGANRVDLFPRLSMPLPLGDYLESTATVGVRDTAYLIHEYGNGNRNGSDTENRFLVDLKVGVGTTMIRDFNVHLGNVSSWSHTLRPYVNYHYIPDVDQTSLPRFDNVDNIAGQSLITYGLDNFFKISGRENNRDYQRRYAYVKIRQSYDLRSQQSDAPLTPLYMEIGYWPQRELRIIYKTDVDMYGEGVIYHSLEAGYRNSRGDTLSTDYLYRKAENINSINLSAKVHLFYNLLAGYSIERSIEDSKTVEENIALIYQPSCWSVELSSNYTPGNQKIMLMFTLANIGNPLGIDLPGF
ncbi:MAG TPA: LPS-assembly protein LptD [Desulfobacteraceae bacterium]|nr:LPS-assembly protein LptD [Desulfobacteraceae bacterium]